MQGTRDFSAFLTIPAAIKFMEENNWNQVATSCRKLTQDNAARFCALLNATPLTPINDDFIVQLYSTTIQTSEPETLQRLLFEKYHIEVPVMRQDNSILIRYSVQAFNAQEDLDQLYAALQSIIATTNLISL